MGIDRQKIVEIRKHIIDCHPDLVGQPNFLAVANNPSDNTLDVICCDQKWQFSTKSTIGTPIRPKAVYAAIRSGVFDDLHLSLPDKAELHVNPISDMEL